MMPKRKKQNQQPSPLQQQSLHPSPLPEWEELGDEEDESHWTTQPSGRPPQWPMERLVAPSQTNSTALPADTLPKRATVDTRTPVPSIIQASMDLLCETVPSHPHWTELSDLAVIYFPVALWWLPWGCSTRHPQSVQPHHHLPYLESRIVFHHWCTVCTLSSNPASKDSPPVPYLCSIQLPPGSSSPSPADCGTGNLFGAISCASVHPALGAALDSWEPWSSFLPFPSSSCLF